MSKGTPVFCLVRLERFFDYKPVDCEFELSTVSVHLNRKDAIAAKERCEDYDLKFLSAINMHDADPEDLDSWHPEARGWYDEAVEAIARCGADREKREALWRKTFKGTYSSALTREYLIQSSHLS